MEPKFDNIEEQRQWEYENLSNDELEERGWVVLDDYNRHPKFKMTWCRFCKYFHGEEKGTCEAYPNGIPDKYAYGRDERMKHSTVQDDQTGNYTWVLDGPI